MKIIRVFPRKTKATPVDDLAHCGLPTFFDEADEVHIDCTFDWDKPRAERLAKEWECVAPVKVGGVAYGDRGGVFTPGFYLRQGYTITSRGCPNRCWFCQAWQKEGNEVRELPITEGWNLLDNNILACSTEHQAKVFEMLSRQKQKCSLSGGLEAKRLTDWHINWLIRLRPAMMWFAFDTPDDFEPLVRASKMLRKAELLPSHNVGCYVLCGFSRDTMQDAEKRCNDVMRLGFFPQAMLYDNGKHTDDIKTWCKWRRTWANKVIVGSRFSKEKA